MYPSFFASVIEDFCRLFLFDKVVLFSILLPAKSPVAFHALLIVLSMLYLLHQFQILVHIIITLDLCFFCSNTELSSFSYIYYLIFLLLMKNHTILHILFLSDEQNIYVFVIYYVRSFRLLKNTKELEVLHLVSLLYLEVYNFDQWTKIKTLWLKLLFRYFWKNIGVDSFILGKSDFSKLYLLKCWKNT